MTQCKLDTCECEAAAGSDYCCLYCENVDNSETLPGHGNIRGLCACGHAECHHIPEVPQPQASISVGGDA